MCDILGCVFINHVVRYPQDFPKCKDLNRVFAFSGCRRALYKTSICKNVNIFCFMCRRQLRKYCPKLHHIPALPLCAKCFGDFNPQPCTDPKIIVSVDKKTKIFTCKSKFVFYTCKICSTHLIINPLTIIKSVFYKKLPKHFWQISFKNKSQWIRFQLSVH